jgi:hypothetical protein
MTTTHLELMGITYNVIYEQEYNSVYIYDVKEIDNPFLGSDENPTYKDGELWGYLTEQLITTYTDGLIYNNSSW